MRSLPQTPCHAVRVKQGSQSLFTLYLYYIKTRAKCQVFFHFIFTLFHLNGRGSIFNFLITLSSLLFSFFQ